MKQIRICRYNNIAGSAMVSILVMSEYLSVEVASQHVRLKTFIFLTYI